MPSSKSSSKTWLREHLNASSSQIEAFIARLDKFLYRTLEPLTNDLLTHQHNAKNIANQLLGFMNVLERAGLAEKLGEIQALYAEELRFIQAEFARSGFRGAISKADLPMVEALIKSDTSKVFSKLNEKVDDITSRMMRTILGGEKPNFEEEFDNVSIKLKGQLQVELETALAGFNRSVTIAKGEELGFELYEYIGPDDAITRPFCADLLAKEPPIYHIDDIREMRNGQDLPVLNYGGGYNCRHQWRPVSEEKAQEMGYKPDA